MSKKRKTPPEATNASDSTTTSSPNASSTMRGPEFNPNASSAVIPSSSSMPDQNTNEFNEENLKDALLDWFKEQPLYQGKSQDEKEIQELVVKDMSDGLVSVIKQTQNTENIDPILLEEIKKHAQKFHQDPKQSVNELPTQILEHLKRLQVYQDILSHQGRSSIAKITKKKAVVVLLEDIDNWIENIPIEGEGTENTTDQLKSKLIHKIGELNMNSEIFNDDLMYDDILGDEVENLLADLPGEKIKNDLPALKRELLALVKKARKKIREENAGQIYKQQLYDTIAKTLPSFDLSKEGKASFEVLKDDVADAFISMHYVGNDCEEACRLKKKINEEIHTFCCNYLKRCPASPIDTTQLNKALYKALETIAKPQNESFTDDVELVKIKSEINNWAKDLPLKNNTGQEKLHTNKIISVLAKKIHEIENEKDLIPTEEYEEKIKKELTKFFKKLPMATENDDDLNELIEKFMKSLKDTEESRKLNASNRQSIEPLVKRTSQAKLRITFNDASVSPCPIDTCSQTSTSSYNKEPSSSQCLVKKTSCVQTPCKKMQAVGSQIDVTPNVVVNEYHWDSIDENSMQPSRVPCPCPTSTRPPYMVMPQPLSPITPRGDESCMQLPRPTCSPSPAPRRLCAGMPQKQFQNSVLKQRGECTPAALKSCLTSKPFPLQPFEKKFMQPRDPELINPCNCAHYQIQAPPQRSLPYYDFDDNDYQVPENSPPCRHESLAESTQAEKQCSNQSFGLALDENNSFQSGNQHSLPYQFQRTNATCPPYSYHQSTSFVSDRSDSSPQRNQIDSLNSQYPRQPSPQRNRVDSQINQYPRQTCACPTLHEAPEQRNVQESSCLSCAQCPESPPMCNRRPHQASQPMNSCPFMASSPPHFSQGQSFMMVRNPMSYSPSLQMPCSLNPRSPCYKRSEPPMSSEEYEPVNCSFQKSETRIGNYEDADPQTCRSSYHDWDRVRDEMDYWEMDRHNFDSIEVNKQRDGKACKTCKHRYREHNTRRF